MEEEAGAALEPLLDEAEAAPDDEEVAEAVDDGVPDEEAPPEDVDDADEDAPDDDEDEEELEELDDEDVDASSPTRMPAPAPPLHPPQRTEVKTIRKLTPAGGMRMKNPSAGGGLAAQHLYVRIPQQDANHRWAGAWEPRAVAPGVGPGKRLRRPRACGSRALAAHRGGTQRFRTPPPGASVSPCWAGGSHTRRIWAHHRSCAFTDQSA